MKKIKKFIICNYTFLIVFALLLMPLVVSADLVPCGKSGGPACTFNDILTLINTVIRFALFDMALPLAAIMFTYAGILLVTSGGSTEARSKAREIFTNVALGLIIAVAAWIIVMTLLSILGYDGEWIGFVKPTR